MSESGLQFRGRPNTIKDNVNQMDILIYCGGGGGGGCPEPMGVPGIVLEYRVSKNIVFNRKIVFENSEFTGVLVAQDAGPAGICSNSAGDYVDVYMGLSDRDDRDLESTAKAGGVILNGLGDLGALVEFEAEKCPQPFIPGFAGGGANPDWSAKVYVYLWWGNSSYVYAMGGDTIEENALRIIKHDNDIKI